MSESHEPSYYEIALTNRQVVVAFVILLVCLLSAFFSGVWIGRESTAQAQEQLVRNTKPPEVKKEGQNLQELEFFDSGETPAVAPEDEQEKPPAPSPADTTLLEDFAGTEPPAEQAAAPETLEPEPSEPAAEPKPGRRANRRNRGKAPEPADAAPAPSTVREEPAIPKGSVVIQVFSSKDRSQAERIHRRLVNGGEKAFLSPVEVGGHTMYRVRIGPFGSREDAKKVAEKVRKDYKYDTWITE